MDLGRKKLLIPSKNKVFLAFAILIILLILFKLTLATTKEEGLTYNLKCGGFENLLCPSGYACTYGNAKLDAETFGECKKKY